ncbi:ABC transporter permease [Devosia sp. 63-57]|uniref:ABC transporter permease n=1 Tax=Devosia sp. 63-57 TaxID=1895751 RepID=UPI00086F30B5|nr:ABC transporter permease [Devosia sp. 63-57]ODT49673.1 MAG: ABC transporter permease [Pelagibacterium sp. SCN 63-126]ODU87685.1 MAG: ABC transporter permease [Pelagibacterium sp. SCN 63-17]OJX45687.1 MAG: ABC transporter permease [Devosia sp. 63-57]
MNADLLIPIIITLIGAATPILIAALGELVVEKSGVLNLGVEGMMLIGAVVAFAVTYHTGNPWLAILCAAIAASAASMIFAFLTLSLSSSQVATGLALTIFGTGFSALFGQAYTGKPIEIFRSVFPTELATDPFWRLIFGHSPLVYFSLLLVFAVWWFLNKSRAGLILRAVGENDFSAHSIGYSVIGVRYAAVAFGGAMAGIAGSCFPLLLTPQWAEKLTAGRGWIALALVVFAAWRPFRLLAGAYLFGLVMTIELYTKASGSMGLLPSEFWAALPYLATIAVLVLISLRRSGNSAAPACLGKPFMPGQ